jgi:hypothetical protein
MMVLEAMQKENPEIVRLIQRVGRKYPAEEGGCAGAGSIVETLSSFSADG